MLEREQLKIGDLKAVAPLIVAPRLAESYKETLERRTNTRSLGQRAKSRKVIMPRGLWNAGQTCHLGASITALSAASSLRTWLRIQTSEKSSLFTTLKRYLLEASASNERHGLDPRPLLSILEEESGWKSRHAQDAHETMARILEILEHWNSRPSKNSETVKGLTTKGLQDTSMTSGRNSMMKLRESSTMMPFTMVTTSCQQCCLCKFKSELLIQKGSIVILPFSTNAESLESLFVSSQISSEAVNMQCYKCREYGKHVRSTDIKRLPDLLIIHLHKAVFICGYTKAAEGQAIVPVQMEIPEGRPIFGVARKRRYALRAVVRHWDGSGGRNGHFDCIVRQDGQQGLASLSGGASWWHVDDDKVLLTTPEAACEPRKAYIVLYELQDSADD